MKKLLMIALLSGIAMADTKVETCKAFINQAQTYQETMKQDSKENTASKMTLAFYKDKVVAHCGNIVAKETYDKNFFANAMMKKTVTTKDNCKLAINMAKEYKNTKTFSSKIIENAHKENIVDNCGTLVSAKSSAFCLFDL